MGLAWRALVPASLVLLLWTAVVIYARLPLWTLTAGNFAVLILAVIVGAFAPAASNRRLPLPGSRFSPA